MRNMSFYYTEMAFRAKRKTVTRRVDSWKSLKPGDRIQGVRKGMGLKRGERVEKLGVIEVVSVRDEPLNAIDQDDVAKEGYPHLTPAAFVKMFCENSDCTPEKEVRRIEFIYV